MFLTYYKIIYPSGHFYIGSTTEENIQRYISNKNEHLIKTHHLFSTNFTVETKTDFSSEKELREFEKQEIKKIH